MPRYLQITPTYNPISLQEFMYVPTQYWNAQESMENDLNKFSENIGTYEQYARMYPNTEASRQYLKFLDNFDKAQEEFYQNGYTSVNSNMFRNLRHEFSRVSKPFKQAAGTYSAIAAQQSKDIKKGLIGNEITFDYILQNPTYSLEDYNNSRILGKDIYNESKNLFKGLTGFDATPKQYNNGTTITTMIPQGYSSEEIQTLFIDENSPLVSQELKDTWKTIKNKYNFDNLTPEQQEQFIYYAMQGALSSTKPARYNTRNAPRFKNINKDTNTAKSKYKGYDPIVIDNGEVLYKNNSQYYRLVQNSDGSTYMSPVTTDIVIGKKVYKQKAKAPAGTLIESGENKTEPSNIYVQAIPEEDNPYSKSDTTIFKTLKI